MPRRPEGDRAMTTAERQARFRLRRQERGERLAWVPADAAAAPASPPPAPAAPRKVPRPARWRAAVAELVTLQAEYRDWLESLPDQIRDAGGIMVERLEAIDDLDLSDLEAINPPVGFGRDR